MNVKRLFHLLITIIVVSSIIALNSCTNEFAAKVRKVTYPPDFKYVTAQDLRSNMAKLAHQIQILDQAIGPFSEQNEAGGLSQQQQVLAALQNIEKTAAKLQAGEAGASHPFLQDHMRDFVNNVARARSAASLEPPRYYLAGRVSGGCVNCHKVNR